MKARPKAIRTPAAVRPGTGAPVSEATVDAVLPGGHVRARTGARAAVEAAVAVPGYAPRAGDTVLLARDPDGRRLYVVGVLTALREVPTLSTSDGVTAAVTDGVLEVRDVSGRLLFEHRGSERRSVVHAAGDLELRADAGSLSLSAAHGVRIHGARGVEVASAASSLAVEPGGVTLAAPRLDARAERAEVAIGDGHLVARRLTTVAERLQQAIGVLETRAGRIIERARSAYREVEDLAQTRAGRIRLVAEATFHLFGKRAALKAEQEMTIKGEKIYLA